MSEPSTDRLVKDVQRVLSHPFWIPAIATNTEYSRLHDDHDGTRKGRLVILFSKDGDAWVTTDGHQGPPLRFRNGFGGSNSPRVYNALLVLAEAMRLDAEKRPDTT